ncbi:MAG: aminoacyl-tRNA hydrolase, partial [Pseudomonadota bacterium]
FEADRSPNFPHSAKARLKRLAGQKWTNDGAIVLQVDTHRSQARNREEARKRLKALLTKALERPKPRLKTRPSKTAMRKRLDEKARRGEIKAQRRKPPID